jgi:hypothetical protein
VHGGCDLLFIIYLVCVEAAVPEWEEEPVKDTESKAHYKDLHAKRPICNKIADTLKVNHTIRNMYG